MIQRFIEDDDGNTAIELDEEGIDYLISGLMDLADAHIGEELTTPAVWGVSAPWWKFWNREEEPVVGEFKLRRVG